ncbi:MAG: response regulator [Xenococcaceae cyanobacterium MO_167.B27]|nr:response regulator [Xenococcaceae cyanobacterium MO_167.B27]
MSHPPEPLDLAELQLERELRQMFELDSQKDLETYLTCVENLENESWIADIQKMYRAVHTIKGGSVTVKADAILQVATVLEDLLSELRYLETIPSLEDGQLQQILNEGGEIIASVLENQEVGVQSKVERIQVLQKQIQQTYLQDWNEQTQLQIEFAEQGFDLVVLDLEIALNQLSETGTVPEKTIQLATQLIGELKEIGQELELASGWTTLLTDASQLLKEPDVHLWKTQWQYYFKYLKTSAKQGGELVTLDTTAEQTSPSLDLEEIDYLLDKIDVEDDSHVDESKLKNSGVSASVPSLDLEEIDYLLNRIDVEDDSHVDESKLKNSGVSASVPSLDLEEIDHLLNRIDVEDDTNVIEESELKVSKVSDSAISLDLEEIDHLLNRIDVEDDSDAIDQPELEVSKDNDAVFEKSQSQTLAASPSFSRVETNSTEDIQIPIPLARLDKSAQSIVDTLMAARTMERFYQDLHQDILKLVSLAKDNVRYITQLRQIQDDYALLDNLDPRIPQTNQSPTPERYRKGYMTINRLLENSLRLSEVGTEAEQTAQKTAERLEKLNNHIINLKDIVEDSRLVPFKNLTFRVRAILRDLINRYDKSVQLVVKGEQIELDVGTTRRLEPILLHLVRNAFDHGIEPAATRVTQGKPEQGTLQLSLQRYGSSYVLVLQDDGKGIDPQKIQAQAQKLKLPLTRTDTPHSLLSVICQSGFSSQSEVSEVSGRGVGMDVVAEQISLLNGSLSLETTLGEGTTFQIHFPVPHLLIPCLLLQAGDRTFAIPTEQIVMTNLWESLEAVKTNKQNISYTWEITHDGVTTPGLDLLGYWYPQFQDRSLDKSAVGVYVRLQPNDSGLWLLADKMLGKLELKIQPFPAPMIPPRGVMGVSLQADSSLVPVLELSSLMEYLSPKSTETPTVIEVTQETTDSTELISVQEQSQTILIVDDAALIRRRIEASLSAYGYTTHTCSDGLEAWNWLQINPHPALMITDIEMPNLDGFTLIDRCRQTKWDFPIVVISSRLAEEWGQEARRLGATDFLTKGFSTGQLINKVQQYCQLN